MCISQIKRGERLKQERERDYQGGDDEAFLVGDAPPVSQNPVAVAKGRRAWIHRREP